MLIGLKMIVYFLLEQLERKFSVGTFFLLTDGSGFGCIGIIGCEVGGIIGAPTGGILP